MLQSVWLTRNQTPLKSRAGNDALNPTDVELSAYLDERLSVQRSAVVERLLREHPELRQRAAVLARRRDQGGHSIGEIWQRNRLSCLSRHQLGKFMLGIAVPELEEYIQFHLKVIGCRFCQANLDDLQTEHPGDSAARQRRYFESSAGLLRSRPQLTDGDSSCPDSSGG